METLRQKQSRLFPALILPLAFLLGWLSTRHGMFYFPDEFRYFIPLNLMEWHHQARPDTLALAGTTADRPLYYLLYAPVLWLQWIASGRQVGVDPLSGWSLLYDAALIPGMFQASLLTLNAFLVYRLSAALSPYRWTAPLAALLYALWLPNLFFTRHVLPVLGAETFLLLAGWQLYRSYDTSLPEAMQLRHVLLSGLFWLCQFLTYPGLYYTLPAFLALIIIGQRQLPSRVIKFLLPGILFIPSAMLVYQGLFHTAYLDTLQGLARSVKEGDAGNALDFIVRYYWVLSPVLLMLGLMAFLRGLFYLGKRQFNIHSVPSLLQLLLYGWLIVYVTSTGSVLYGRILLPLAILSIWQISLLLGAWLDAPGKRREVAFTVLLICLASLVMLIPGFLSMRFPLDAFNAFETHAGIKLPPTFMHAQRMQDFEVKQAFPAPGIMLAETRTLFTQSSERFGFSCQAMAPLAQRPETVYFFLNTTYAFPITQVQPVLEDEFLRGEVLMTASHPVRQPIYQFEGLKQAERERVNETPVPMLALKNPCR